MNPRVTIGRVQKLPDDDDGTPLPPQSFGRGDDEQIRAQLISAGKLRPLHIALAARLAGASVLRLDTVGRREALAELAKLPRAVRAVVAANPLVPAWVRDGLTRRAR